MGSFNVRETPETVALCTDESHFRVFFVALSLWTVGINSRHLSLTQCGVSIATESTMLAVAFAVKRHVEMEAISFVNDSWQPLSTNYQKQKSAMLPL